jgi:polygalacturonase
LIYAEKAAGIAIIGRGTIDGHNATWNFHPGLEGGSDEDGRPRNILLVSCSGVRVEGITLLNPVMWNQHYLNCEDVVVDGIKVYSHDRPNADGIDIDGCRWFTLRNSVLDSDDDGVTLKSTGPEACEDILVTGCRISSHCAVRRSADPTPAFPESLRKDVDGITAITIGGVDGGVCENIKLSDITIEDTQSAVFIRLGRRNRPYRKDIPVVRDSVMRGLTPSRITARGTGDVGCFILGLPGNPIRELTLVDIAVESLGGIAMEEVPPEVEEKPDARSPFHLIDVKTVSMTGVSAARHGAGVPFVVKRDVADDTIVEPENWRLRIL